MVYAWCQKLPGNKARSGLLLSTVKACGNRISCVCRRVLGRSVCINRHYIELSLTQALPFQHVVTVTVMAGNGKWNETVKGLHTWIFCLCAFLRPYLLHIDSLLLRGLLTGGCCPGWLVTGKSTTGDVSRDQDDSCK